MLAFTKKACLDLKLNMIKSCRRTKIYFCVVGGIIQLRYEVVYCVKVHIQLLMLYTF